MKLRKRKQPEEEQENYLLPEDIENIINDFAPLEHTIKLQEGETTGSFIDLMCGLVENAIYTRVRDLSRQRKIEKITEFASAQARDDAETPRYYRPWRRLFRLTPNRAMELIVGKAEQTARLKHMQQQVENDKLEALADDWDEKYKNGQPINFEGDDGEEFEEEPAEEPEEVEEPSEPEEVEEDEGPEEVAPTLPERKRRVKSSEREPSEETDGGQITIDEAIETPSEDEQDDPEEELEEESAEEPEEVEEAEEPSEDEEPYEDGEE